MTTITPQPQLGELGTIAQELSMLITSAAVHAVVKESSMLRKLQLVKMLIRKASLPKQRSSRVLDRHCKANHAPRQKDTGARLNRTVGLPFALSPCR